MSASHRTFLLGGVGLATLASLALAAPASAQDQAESDQQDDGVEEAVADYIDGANPPPPGGEREIGFEADTLEYDSEQDIIFARGSVLLRDGDRSVRADEVRWNRPAGRIDASGNVRYVDGDGNQLYASQLELSDKFETGALSDLLLVLREGGRLAAESGERTDDGRIALVRGAYSGCAVTTPEGCPKRPSWKITAERVVYDPDASRVRFEGGYFSLFGQRILPLPTLELRTDGGPSSGLLVPSLSISRSNGVELSGDYYWRLAENRDLKLGAHIFTEAAPMATATYRELSDKGAFQATGYLTRSRRINPFTQTPRGTQDFRGYLAINGRYQFDENWSFTGATRVTSDRTFLRRYDISRDDRLRTVAELERIDDDSYFVVAGFATQTLRLDQKQGEVPIALPLIDYRHRIKDPLLGGTITLRGNSLAVTRSDGQDTQRALASAQWQLRRVTPLGQVVELTALARGDVYHTQNTALTSVASYRGEEGWQGRTLGLAAMDVSWPLVGPLFGGSQVLTPRVQIVGTLPIRNTDIPNEDSRAIDLEDVNLFSLNRFPGDDRFEDGTRITYGVDWELTKPDWRVSANIGQSYRLDDKQIIFPDGTGLSDRFSDIVGRTRVRYKDFVSLTYRFRLDKDNLTARRTEIDATVGNRRTYAEIGYLRLDRNIPLLNEDLGDREELRAAGRVAFADYWSLFGSAVVNMTNRDEDPTLQADGFEPIRTRLGIAYQDDCIDLGITWRRDFVTQGDALRGNTIELTFRLLNLGFSG
ncbi:LPS assembly protein LptD [Citromicrobium bathyomarinum]|uniref:LPS-assembly protein LptD n=1 Tax=Citromicrobium TaxID=72173 RepID=UPI00031B72E4|nr:LPS assembly protein LptD [Citromicrobium sp. JLT1363]